MQTISGRDLTQVSGGFLMHWAIGHMLSEGANYYAEWVSNGAGGWREEYDPNGYDDPLL